MASETDTAAAEVTQQLEDLTVSADAPQEDNKPCEEDSIFLSLEDGIQEVLASTPHLEKSRADALVRSSDKNADGLYSRTEINDLLKQLAETKTKLQKKLQARACDGCDTHITTGQATRALMPADSMNMQYTRVIKGMMERFKDNEDEDRCSIEKVADFFSYMTVMRDSLIEQFKDFPAESSFDDATAKVVEVTGLSSWAAYSVLCAADDNDDSEINKQEFIDMWKELFC